VTPPPPQLFRFVLQTTDLLLLGRLLGAGIGKAASTPPQRVVGVPWSEFVRAANRGAVGTAQVDGVHLLWQLREPGAGKGRAVAAAPAAPPPALLYATTRPADAALPYDALLRSGAAFGAPDKRGNRWVAVGLTVLYAGVILSMLGRLPFPRGLGLPGRGGVGRERGRGGRGGTVAPEVTFADVAGVDEAKEELMEVVAILKEPGKFAVLGARPPTGVLLVGPPGTGKTLLAKAVAGEAGVPFFSVAASEFVELYVGMGASRVRDVFARAKAAAPAIVFIDEIDAIGKGRSDGRLRGLGNDEREQTLNQLLTELDGFDSNSLVICLAATNRPDTLDAALRRPGRFDRTVSVDRPDRVGREAILGVHVASKMVPLARDVVLADVAAQTVGFTGAELATLVNEAALLAARRSSPVVDAAAFSAAVLRALAGVERKRSILFGAEKTCVARHEAGHALVSAAAAACLPPGALPATEAISIVARSNGALGYAYSPPSGDERALLFADELRARLAILMAGRAAEELSLSGRVSTGASDDIARATDLAYRAVAEYGLCAAVGPLSLQALAAGGGSDALLGDRTGETGAAVEREVAVLLKGALGAAKATLVANAGRLDDLGAALEAAEKLSGPALAGLLGGVVGAAELRRFITSAT